MAFALTDVIEAVYYPGNGLNASERAVLVYLAWQADEQGETWRSTACIAEACGLKPRQTSTILRGLEKKGWLEIVPQPGKASRFRLKDQPLQKLLPSQKLQGFRDTPAKTAGVTPAKIARVETEPPQKLQDTHAKIAGVEWVPQQNLRSTPAKIAGVGQLPLQKLQGTPANIAEVDPEPLQKLQHTPANIAGVQDKNNNYLFLQQKNNNLQLQDNYATAFERLFRRPIWDYGRVRYELESYLDDGMEEAAVIYAMEKAAAAGKAPDYALGILRRWYAKGILTLAQAREEEAAWERRKQQLQQRTLPTDDAKAAEQEEQRRRDEELERIFRQRAEEERRRLRASTLREGLDHFILKHLEKKGWEIDWERRVPKAWLQQEEASGMIANA